MQLELVKYCEKIELQDPLKEDDASAPRKKWLSYFESDSSIFGKKKYQILTDDRPDKDNSLEAARVCSYRDYSREMKIYEDKLHN